jgi:cytochrome bd-type quinol oxidase subunit 2
MKKINSCLTLFIILTAVMGVVIAPAISNAADNIPNDFPPDLKDLDLWKLLAKVLNWFANIVLLISAIMIVYAGFTYVTASGKEDKIKLAMQILIYALVGFAVALLAKFLVNLVTNFIAGQTVNWPTP